ncbi:MAG: hypothetical protein HQK89_17400 [Nitrospirae bacterium]|nr:hypothetical protein [Nitrospirota bacterium]
MTKPLAKCYTKFMDTIIGIDKDFDLTEIIDGEEIVSPSPFGKHRDIASKLHITIGYYVQVNKLGKIFSSPLIGEVDKKIDGLESSLKRRIHW